MDAFAGQQRALLTIDGRLALSIGSNAKGIFEILRLLFYLPQIMLMLIFRLCILAVYHIPCVVLSWWLRRRSQACGILCWADTHHQTTYKESREETYATKPRLCKDGDGQDGHSSQDWASATQALICILMSLQNAGSDASDGACTSGKHSEPFKFGRPNLNRNDEDRNAGLIDSFEARNGDGEPRAQGCDATLRLKSRDGGSKRGDDGTLRQSFSSPSRPRLQTLDATQRGSDRPKEPPKAPRRPETPPPLKSSAKAPASASIETAVSIAQNQLRAFGNTAGVPRRRCKGSRCPPARTGRPRLASSQAHQAEIQSRATGCRSDEPARDPAHKSDLDSTYNAGPLDSVTSHGIRHRVGEGSGKGKAKTSKSSTYTIGANGSGSASFRGGHSDAEQNPTDDEDEEDAEGSDSPSDIHQGGSLDRKRTEGFRCPKFAANPRACNDQKCRHWCGSKIAAVTRHMYRDTKGDEVKTQQVKQLSGTKLKPEERWRRYYRVFGGTDPAVCPYKAETHHRTPVSPLLEQLMHCISLSAMSPPIILQILSQVRSYSDLVTQKDVRDSEARRRHLQRQADSERELQEDLNTSQEELGGALDTLVTSSSTNPTRIDTGQYSPEGTIMSEGSRENQETILLHMTGNAGPRTPAARRSSLAMETSPNSGFTDPALGQDPSRLMVPLDRTAPLFTRLGIPSAMDRDGLQRTEPLNQIMVTADMLMDQDTPPLMRAQLHEQQQQREQQQHLWSSGSYQQHHQHGYGLSLDSAHASLPDYCQCSMHLERPWCLACSKAFGQCMCRHEFRRPFCRNCCKITECWCGRCTKGSHSNS